jgi:hypothetical protein
MSTFDTGAWLRSLSGHLDHHPELLGTVSSFEANEAHLRVGGVDLYERGKLRAFAQWVATMQNPGPIMILAVPGPSSANTHLRVIGQLADGATAKVSVCLRPADLRPFDGHVRFEFAGVTFPADLLLQVTGTPPAVDTTDVDADVDQQLVADADAAAVDLPNDGDLGAIGQPVPDEQQPGGDQ